MSDKGYYVRITVAEPAIDVDRCYVRITNVDKSAVEKFHRIVGVGTVVELQKGALWRWQANGLDAARAMELLLPFLKRKRSQALELIAAVRGAERTTRDG